MAYFFSSAGNAKPASAICRALADLDQVLIRLHRRCRWDWCRARWRDTPAMSPSARPRLSSDRCAGRASAVACAARRVSGTSPSVNASVLAAAGSLGEPERQRRQAEVIAAFDRDRHLPARLGKRRVLARRHHAHGGGASGTTITDRNRASRPGSDELRPPSGYPSLAIRRRCPAACALDAGVRCRATRLPAITVI